MRVEHHEGAIGNKAAPRTSDAAKPMLRAEALETIQWAFERLAAAGMSKYMQLHRAILGSVETGVLRPGDQIPPEDLLAEKLGISLGTIRRALAHLAAGGVITRQHGRGTFIATHSRALGDNWHFRFVGPDGHSFLPAYSHVIARNLVQQQGPWSDALGRDDVGYVSLERCFNVDDKFLCHSQFYLRHDRFKVMLEWPIEDFENVNLKKILDERFGLPTVQITQRARMTQLSDAVCDLMSLRRRASGMRLEILAYSLGNMPLSYHAIHIPPTEYPIDLSLVQVQPGTRGTVE